MEEGDEEEEEEDCTKIGEGSRENGERTRKERLGNLTELKYVEAEKEGTENETRRREDLPSALSVVNRAHVVNSLLSQALLLFSLRRESDRQSDTLEALSQSPESPHVDPSKTNAVQLPREIFPTVTNAGCLSSFDLFSQEFFRSSVDRSH